MVVKKKSFFFWSHKRKYLQKKWLMSGICLVSEYLGWGRRGRGYRWNKVGWELVIIEAGWWIAGVYGTMYSTLVCTCVLVWPAHHCWHLWASLGSRFEIHLSACMCAHPLLSPWQPLRWESSIQKVPVHMRIQPGCWCCARPTIAAPFGEFLVRSSQSHPPAPDLPPCTPLPSLVLSLRTPWGGRDQLVERQDPESDPSSIFDFST